jgi:hypothetical protein
MVVACRLVSLHIMYYSLDKVGCNILKWAAFTISYEIQNYSGSKNDITVLNNN